MPHGFLDIGNAAKIVGQAPWPARDALVPLFAHRIKLLPRSEARRGVGADKGGRPTIYAEAHQWENFVALPLRSWLGDTSRHKPHDLSPSTTPRADGGASFPIELTHTEGFAANGVCYEATIPGKSCTRSDTGDGIADRPSCGIRKNTSSTPALSCGGRQIARPWIRLDGRLLEMGPRTQG